ncbi:glutathione S-transferase LANCL1-like [Protopterus annectens]|uniref:glutathione S-transferase LANCL1-like n=1 Tax=Protopterus annectens TaxID=7888 RepID=UPI001CFAED67|nr:glutathione S-transferase LANCL1-like [Protopterus annectens]
MLQIILLNSMDQRAFPNPYKDYDGTAASVQEFLDPTGKLSEAFTHRLSAKINELLQHMEVGLKTADPRDGTVYTGWAGIALLYLHLFNVYEDAAFLQKALEYVSRSLKSLDRRSFTFLCGDAGPLAIAAVIYHKLQKVEDSEECVNRLLQLYPLVGKVDTRIPDEMLYGRIGYLYALAFVNEQFRHEKIPKQYMQQILELRGLWVSIKKQWKLTMPIAFKDKALTTVQVTTTGSAA